MAGVHLELRVEELGWALGQGFVAQRVLFFDQPQPASNETVIRVGAGRLYSLIAFLVQILQRNSFGLNFKRLPGLISIASAITCVLLGTELVVSAHSKVDNPKGLGDRPRCLHLSRCDDAIEVAVEH